MEPQRKAKCINHVAPKLNSSSNVSAVNETKMTETSFGRKIVPFANKESFMTYIHTPGGDRNVLTFEELSCHLSLYTQLMECICPWFYGGKRVVIVTEK